MSHEEKLEEAKRLYETANADQKYVLESLFPELAESKDERVRKDLIIYLRSILSNKKYGDKFIESWIAWLEAQGEQRPAWGKGDENVIDLILSQLRSDNFCGVLSKSLLKEVESWFKSLKDRVQPQPKQEWSEEDEYHKRQILRILKDNGCSQTLQERTEKWIEERLKSLRPQNKTYYWTENEIKFAISDYIRGAESYEKMVEKLRCLKPQSQWKPSKEQMTYIQDAISKYNEFSNEYTGLVKLYNDLKKLRGE